MKRSMSGLVMRRHEGFCIGEGGQAKTVLTAMVAPRVESWSSSAQIRTGSGSAARILGGCTASLLPSASEHRQSFRKPMIDPIRRLRRTAADVPPR